MCSFGQRSVLIEEVDAWWKGLRCDRELALRATAIRSLIAAIQLYCFQMDSSSRRPFHYFTGDFIEEDNLILLGELLQANSDRQAQRPPLFTLKKIPEKALIFGDFWFWDAIWLFSSPVWYCSAWWNQDLLALVFDRKYWSHFLVSYMYNSARLSSKEFPQRIVGSRTLSGRC